MNREARFAAEGYARASGKVGVCMATSGPGATNLVTAIADAFMDSTPMVAITGQVYQKFIGKSAFQETDFFGMTLPVVKHSYLILDVNDIPHVLKEAFPIARTGRPGPVVVDIPKDVQQALVRPIFPPSIELRSSKKPAHATDDELKQILDLITEARQTRPLCGRRHHFSRGERRPSDLCRTDADSSRHNLDGGWAPSRKTMSFR